MDIFCNSNSCYSPRNYLVKSIDDVLLFPLFLFCLNGCLPKGRKAWFFHKDDLQSLAVITSNLLRNVESFIDSISAEI